MEAGGGQRRDELRSFLDNSSGLSFNLETRTDRVSALKHGYVTGSRQGGGAGSTEQYVAQLLKARAARSGRLEKLERLSERGRRVREEALLGRHREVWQREWNKLQLDKQQVERDLEEWTRERASESNFWRDFLSEVATAELKLSEEREKFFQQIVQPFLRARGSLRSDKGRVRGWKEVTSVKSEGDRAMKLMEEEYGKIWGEISQIRVNRESKLSMRVIPPELCGAPGYEDAVRELQLLDNRYTLSLESLHGRYRAVAGCDNSGWSLDDAERFRHIVGQYQLSLRNRRTLLIDRLMREFPHLPRSEIIRHETWHCSVGHYHRQLASIQRSWQKNRAELADRLTEMLKEQKELLAKQAITAAAQAEQKRQAHELYLKVCQWRRERELEEEREERERERQRQREQQEREKEEEKMARHREKLKKELDAYCMEQMRAAEREKEEDKRLREERERERSEERRRERERVSHRQQLLGERRAREEAVRERAMAAAKEREKRLERLRQTVEVKASCDPGRILRSTKASEMRGNTESNSPLHTQHPLFILHGYRDDVVTSDPRFKVAAALKEAGLLRSKYARVALATVPPLHPPRRDNISNVLK